MTDERGGGDQLGTSLTDLHMALVRAFQAQRSQLRPLGARLGLGPGQPKLLSYLAVHGTAAQREIASYFGIDAAAVSRMLDTLEKGGFVTSTVKPGDRRAKAVTLTEHGRATVAAWDVRCAEVEAQMLAGFTSEERSAFAGYLERLRKNLVEPARPSALPKDADAAPGVHVAGDASLTPVVRGAVDASSTSGVHESGNAGSASAGLAAASGNSTPVAHGGEPRHA